MLKKISLLIILFIVTSSYAQVFPLTASELPQNSYRKDTQNQLTSFEGNWKGTWNGKTFLINFKKLTNVYDNSLKIWSDHLIGKFQVKDSSGNVLFDNLSISDIDAKIVGGKIFSSGVYSLIYADPELCNKGGFLKINFVDSTKMQLRLKFAELSNLIESDCFYHGKPADQRPEPIPKDIVLTKQ
ncbi:DUF6705 family protein [Chryseobacterium sp. SIMBA_028]|uniref:DUF6705 family protein n=1 Tax=Chryseobacterium sp. SIMBA_028 TaxID=3085771 RepID=UPI00397BD8E0